MAWFVKGVPTSFIFLPKTCLGTLYLPYIYVFNCYRWIYFIKKTFKKSNLFSDRMRKIFVREDFDERGYDSDKRNKQKYPGLNDPWSNPVFYHSYQPRQRAGLASTIGNVLLSILKYFNYGKS